MTPERLRRMREKSGLTQDEVARRLNITRGAVGHWERGKNEPAYKVLKELARLYNTSAAYLIGETDDPAPLRQAQTATKGTVHPQGWERLSPLERRRIGRISKGVERILVEEFLREKDAGDDEDRD